MWKSIAKKASFTKKGSARSNDVSSARASSGSEHVAPADMKSLEKKGSAALGPFSMDEFGQLQHLFSSLAAGGGKHLDPEKFKRHFKLEGADWFPERLLNAFVEAEKLVVGSRSDKVTLEGFREGVASSCRSSRAGMVQVLFDICNTGGAAAMDEAQLARLFEAAHLCSVAAWRTPDRPALKTGSGSQPFRADKLAQSVSNHLRSQGQGGSGGVTAQMLKLWVAERAPLLHHCLSTFIHTRCFLYGDAKAKGIEALPCSASNLPRSLAVFSPPQPEQASFLIESHRAELFGLALASKALQGPWLRIYTSEEDGMSFNRIAFKLVGYGGPTVILIRERGSGAVWGGCADSPWKESNSFYGGEASFLMRLSPDFKMIPSKISSNGHFQYLNLKGFSLPHGIGMGGSTEAFRFFLPEALDGTCVGRSACLTFEQGELCPNNSRNFELDAIEVWGVGGEEALGEALEAREKQRQYTAQQIQKARQVDKSKFATNAFDKEFLLSKTFGGGGHYNKNEDRRQGQS